MLEVKRQELKFLPGMAQSIQIEKELEQVMDVDPHSVNGYYNVRSLYFDSLNDIDFWQKMSGDEVRKKIRIRIYSPEDKKAKLEMKQKVGKYQRKVSLIISKEEALALIDGRTEILLDREEEEALLFYRVMTEGIYRPKSIIEYERRAFLFPEFNNRVTLDRNIRFTEDYYNLFDPQINYLPTDTDHVVLEIKYDGYLYEPVRMIAKKHHLNNVSVSKYTAGRII